MNRRAIYFVQGALLLSNVMAGIDSTNVNTALPAIIADLHGLRLMAWIVAVFLLGTAVSTLIWSKMGERFGNKRAYQMTTALFIVGSLLQGLAPNIWFLIIARGVAGLGNGGMISLPYIMYADIFKNPRDRMRALGLVSACFSMATIIGPMVGGVIVDVWSWHWIFYLNVPIGIVSAVLLQIFYQEPKREHNLQPMDRAGVLLMAVGIISLLGGIELIGMVSLWIVAIVIVGALIVLGSLTIVERRAVDPVIPGRLFKNAPLVVDFVLFVLIWGAFVAFLTYSPMWAQGLLGTSALIGGATQIPSAFANFGGSESVPRMRRHLTPHRVLTINIIILTLTFVPLMIGGVKLPYWVLLLAGFFEGWGNGACFNELQVKVQVDADQRDIPVATSFSYLIRMLSQTFTTAIFGLIMNQALTSGVARSDGKITMAMMNQLSDASRAGRLPAHLVPMMRGILHTGLQNIMIVAFGLMIVALVINLWAQRHETQRQAQS
ncbi:MFS transporter [Lactiplantibacillus plantarum]|uniref:MFS transporter n=1 Tax=Lactiplantibacillus plantarum TaxID=1590 RepID=UPI0002B3FBCF|nr:MFS transporter [Lactiplantibacillus plantarum]AGE39381.1 Drug resistance transport protein, major facilitator subfamily (MFS), EmrB/QacA subfamily [Lactiplantibacillus plantarum ZJ316]MCB7149908.1 MFS transporter [Lactiplantibacillus plantarum]MCB7170644.1 MFS transporter [Lactiplantibacillus plantarum]QHM38418.1 Multidrug resistance protein 3 [Lactiplantibacillus plantarum]UZF03868.1 MFS transporter [Lactiplantibacillus plantarum]